MQSFPSVCTQFASKASGSQDFGQGLRGPATLIFKAAATPQNLLDANGV